MEVTLQKELLTATVLLSVLMAGGLVMHLLRGLFGIKTEWIRYFFAADVFMLTIGVITSNRSITGEESILAPSSASSHAVITSQLLTIVILAVACERIFRFLIDRELSQSRTLPLLGALLLFFLAVNVVTPLLGIYAEFQHNFLYAPLMALALFAVAQRDSYASTIRLVRNAYVIFLAAGLACMVVKPDMVADFVYQEGIAGLHIRFYGFGTHPNALAPYCLMLLCCLWVCPFQGALKNRLAWAVGTVSLTLTQSKTTITLGFLMFAFMWYMGRRSTQRAALGARYRPVSNGAVVAIALMSSVAALGGLAAVLLDKVPFDALHAAMSSDITLTGRTTIWKVSLSDLWENPLFGYGADLWGPAYQQHVRIFVAHAHNQYVHTLGDSGFVGLIALLIYCLVLGIYSWKARHETRWLSLSIAVYIFLRGITEAPLIVDSVFGADFATHMVLLVLCVGAAGRRGARSQAVDRPWEPRSTWAAGPVQA